MFEKISIEFVVGVKKDETRSEAKERVRTLFVDINDKAQKLSKAAGAALKDTGYNKVAKKVLEKDNWARMYISSTPKLFEVC